MFYIFAALTVDRERWSSYKIKKVSFAHNIAKSITQCLACNFLSDFTSHEFIFRVSKLSLLWKITLDSSSQFYSAINFVKSLEYRKY